MNGISIGDFFTHSNSVTGVTQEQYLQAKMLVNTAEAFARTTNQSVYIIDYIKKGFVYVSDSLALLCGEDTDKIREFGYELYIRHVPEEVQKMLPEINEAGFRLFNSFPEAERKNYFISYDFNITCGRKKTLVNHKLTPFVLTDDGRILLALCTISPSAKKEPGHVMMRHTGSDEYHEYDFDLHRWVQKKEKPLSELERGILLLSARGYTMSQIALDVCKSVDTIKTCKRLLFERFEVTSIVEALTFATNCRLL